jgi:hypothetical protein
MLFPTSDARVSQMADFPALIAEVDAKGLGEILGASLPAKQG